MEVIHAMIEFMPELKIFFAALGVYMGGLIIAAIINPRGGGITFYDDCGRRVRISYD